MTAADPLTHPVVRRYLERTPTSAGLMRRAAAVMPGGNTRTTVFHPPYPVVFERGSGAWLWDVDGNRHVDVYYNGLSIIHGHGYEPIAATVRGALAGGTAWPGASRVQIEFAEHLSARLPTGGLVRFANSGSEACMLAVKAARRFTGRPLVLKLESAYHGSDGDLEAGLYGHGEIAGRTVLARFNDLDSCRAALERHAGQVAAVIYEPLMFTGRAVAPEQGFLDGLEALARRHGVLTILDDCLMLRLAPGGSSEKYGLRPDVVALGKFIGGGTPLGAVVGRPDVMQVFDPRRPGAMFHGGSFNGNVLGCAAGLVALQHLGATEIARMDGHMLRLRDALAAKAAALGLAVEVSGAGSVGGLSFRADGNRHEDDPAAFGLAALFHLACLNEGVALGPGGLFALATAFDEEALACAIHGMEAALEAVAAS